MAKRIKCPFCGGMYRQRADGGINMHGERGYRYPNCMGPVAPAHAQCTSCKKTFETVEGFTEHRFQGTCLHPSGLGYREDEGVWRRGTASGQGT